MSPKVGEPLIFASRESSGVIRFRAVLAPRGYLQSSPHTAQSEIGTLSKLRLGPSCSAHTQEADCESIWCTVSGALMHTHVACIECEIFHRMGCVICGVTGAVLYGARGGENFFPSVPERIPANYVLGPHKELAC